MAEAVFRWCYRHRWKAVVAWTLIVVGLSTAVSTASYSREFETPGESQRALDLLDSRFPRGESTEGIDLVLRAANGVREPAVRNKVTALLKRAERLPHVAGTVSPYGADGADRISDDGRTAFATLRLDVGGFDVPDSLVDDVKELAAGAGSEGLRIEAGGQAVRNAESNSGGQAELIGFAAAALILLIVFGSVVAAGLPLLTAVVALGAGMGGIALLTAVTDIPEFAPQLAAMVGIGVGIDYALFIITRYREARTRGLAGEEAVLDAMNTAGRAVLVAGTTVVLSLLGVLIIGDRALRGLGIAASVAVLFTMLASVTLLPALLALLGPRIDALPLLRGRRARAAEAAARGQGWTFRWVRGVQRRPVLWGIVSTAALVVLAMPAFSLRLGSADAGNMPESTSSRQAHELLAEGFGPGFNGPLLIVADLRGLPAAERAPVLGALRERVAGDGGVAGVSAPRLNEAGDTAVLTVRATTGPQERATESLVERIREEAVPAAGDGVRAHVGGRVAGEMDSARQIGDRLALLIALVIALALVLLLLAFRSLLLPVKAALMNLLVIAASYGTVVAVFQWGWGAGLIGLPGGAPVESVMPLLMFAIAFGLSMDYEVFLLSRVREHWLRTGDNSEAVAQGVGATARVVTAAGVIMLAVFGSFMLGEDRLIKLFGFALAVPILLDILVVRLVLVPATMELLGRANWYLPPVLDRVLPRFDVEAPGVPGGPPGAAGAPGTAVHTGGERAGDPVRPAPAAASEEGR
ncbi:MMPL family transporter [Streptomyces sp. NPDC001889]